MPPTAMSHAAHAPPCVVPSAARRASAGRAAPARVARASARASSRIGTSSSSSGVASTSSRVRDGAYKWRGHRVHFERGGCDPSVATKHVVFLHGFGVGTFHYERQLRDLGALVDAETSDRDGHDSEDPTRARTTCVWALDFVGQGASWPCDESDDAFPYVNEADAAPEGFRYSVDTWVEQTTHFLETVVRPRDGGAYVAGNSLGGYVAALVAATEISRVSKTTPKPTNRPKNQLVKGLILLNATPFWAFVPADARDARRRAAPWDGALPAPRWVRALFETYWNAFRSRRNVEGLLGLVYGDAGKVTETLVSAILAPTDRAPALAAFCSVVFSPKSALALDEATRAIRDAPGASKIPVALVYGRDDPWVVPLWGQRMKRAIPRAAYYELPGVGHCPAHEAPERTNACVADFVRRREEEEIHNAKRSEADGAEAEDDAGGSESATRASAAAAEFLVDGAPRNVFERLAAWRETVGGVGA